MSRSWNPPRRHFCRQSVIRSSPYMPPRSHFTSSMLPNPIADAVDGLSFNPHLNSNLNEIVLARTLLLPTLMSAMEHFVYVFIPNACLYPLQRSAFPQFHDLNLTPIGRLIPTSPLAKGTWCFPHGMRIRRKEWINLNSCPGTPFRASSGCLTCAKLFMNDPRGIFFPRR